jgi:N-carbamoylputrescine amidase
MLTQVGKAETLNADLIVFPEASLTGLVNNDDPRHDLSLGVRIPGKETRALAAAAKCHRIWIALGLLERAGSRLYDTALLITPSGRIRLKYRRISAGWHGAKASTNVYGRGRALSAARTPFGSVVFLVCGDLFDAQLIERVRKLRPDLVLVPLARSFEDGSVNQRRWNRQEKPAYFRQARRCGAAALLVNSLDRRTHSFGGAWAVSADGVETAAMPIGRAGMVTANMARRETLPQFPADVRTRPCGISVPATR